MNRHRNPLLHSLGVFALLLASCLTAQAQTSYSYRDLGTLGGTSSSAAGVNNAGQVVGASTLANGAAHAFYWSSSTGMVDIGTFGGTGGGAKAINNLGEVVGHTTNVAGVWHAFYWNNVSYTLTDLNSLLSPTDAANWVLTYAWKINDNRKVIGNGTLTIGGVASNHGYLLDLNTGTITDIGAASAVDGINNLPSPQVTTFLSGNSFLYSGGSLTSLSPLIRAFSVNNASETVGYLFNAHAAYRSPSGVITDMGTFYGGNGGLASGYSINNASTPMVVGDSYYSQPGRVLSHRAFRWIVGSGAIQDLNSITANLGKTKPWILYYAWCVSDTGYIACRANKLGYDDGNQRAFLLTPQ